MYCVSRLLKGLASRRVRVQKCRVLIKLKEMAVACSGHCTEKAFDEYEDYLTRYLENTKNLALLLDYDGTLTPIVAHPDLATIPPETKVLLEDLSNLPNVFVAIISGRNPENVKHLVGLNNIVYAGNHGLEVIYPDGSKYVHQLPTEFDGQVKDLVTNLEKSVVRDGAWIENKGASLTFHFRATPEDKRPEIETKAREIIENAGFKVGNAHMALEARPKVEWNKGSVALLILNREFGENQWQGKVKVIFAGDDTTDEDAMLVKATGYRGVSVNDGSPMPDVFLTIFNDGNPMQDRSQ